MIANLRVDVIRKVNRSCSLRKVDNVSLWSQHKNSVFEKIDFKRGEHFVRRLVEGSIFVFTIPLLKLPHPGELFFVHERRSSCLTSGFVRPVRRDTKLSFPVHVVGSDLKIHHAFIGAEYGSMQALIPIWFWKCDEILDASGHRLPKFMQHSECPITVFNVF